MYWNICWTLTKGFRQLFLSVVVNSNIEVSSQYLTIVSDFTILNGSLNISFLACHVMSIEKPKMASEKGKTREN